jgi:membrane protease YdiL (CAAX protease family)
MLSAFIVTGIADGATGIRELLGRLLSWRVGVRWILIALLSPVALYLVAAVALRLWSDSWPDFSGFGSTVEITGLGWLGGWAFHVLTFGIGEETGWRGFALPRLQRNRSALSATLILSAFWALWHLPMFFYKENFMSMGIPMMLLWLVGMVCGAIVLTWLYNSTGGSILMVALWHGTYNAAVTATEPTVAAVVSTIVWIGAIVIVIVAKPANLSRSGRHTL